MLPEHKDIMLPLIAKTEGDRKRLLMKEAFESIVRIAGRYAAEMSAEKRLNLDDRHDRDGAEYEKTCRLALCPRGFSAFSGTSLRCAGTHAGDGLLCGRVRGSLRGATRPGPRDYCAGVELEPSCSFVKGRGRTDAADAFNSGEHTGFGIDIP